MANISKAFIAWFCFLFSIVVFFYLLLFDLDANVTAPSLEILKTSYNFKIMFATIGAVFGIALAYLLFDYILKKFSAKNRTRYLVFLLVSFIAFLVYSLKTPFSPNNDSYDMLGFLEQMLRGEGFSKYATAYLTYTATNRITLFIYFPLVKLLGNIQLGVQILNFIMLFGTIILLSGSVKKLFGYKMSEISLFALLPLCPFMMLVGPYIYLPTLFFSALCFFLYLSETKTIRTFSYIVCAFLFILRPTALAFMLVFIAVEALTKRKFLTYSIRLVLILILCFVIKGVTAEVLYRTGMHPYPKLHNSAGIWAIELGTRDQGINSGVCTYTAYTKQFDDNIAQGFNKLWNYYEISNPDDLDEILEVQKDIKAYLIARNIDMIVQNPKQAIKFYATKFANYYRDRYRPYYFGININSTNYAEFLYKNYDKRYFLYQNVLLLLFYTISVIFLAKKIFYRKKQVEYETEILALILGCTAVSCVFIILTEVMKRYTFDFYVPMAIVICYGIGKLIVYFQSKKWGKSSMVTFVIISILLMASTYGLYNSFNLSIFKDCKITTEKINTQESLITLKLSQPCSEQGYNIRQNFEKIIPMYQKDTFTFTTKADADKQVPFEVLLPDGNSFEVLQQKIYNNK